MARKHGFFRPHVLGMSGISSTTLREGVGFSLTAYLLASGSSLWNYAPTDGQFQENAGPTPADDPTEVIGFKLDSGGHNGKTLAQVLAAASNMYVPGGSTEKSAAPSSSTESPNGTINLIYVSGTARREFAFASEAGETYALELESVGPVNACFVRAGSSSGGTQNLADTTLTVGGTRTIYFVASAATTYVRFFGGANSSVVITSVRKAGGKAATQSTANYKPKVASGGGATYDGADDCHSIPNAVPSGDFGIFIKASFGGSIASTQVLLGSQDGSSNGFYLGVTTGGKVRFKLGSTVLDAATGDVRGGDHVIGITVSGTAMQVWLDGVVVGAGTAAGARPPTALLIGGLNANGTFTAFYGGTMFKPAFIPAAVSDAEAANLSSALAA